MKQFLLFSLVVIAIVTLWAGCELITNKPADTSSSAGRDLVINEVFTISPDKYYAYSWIELFNPTTRTLAWSDVTHPITGFIYGENGTLRRTNDNGKTWIDLASGTTSTLTGVSMILPDTGFAIGETGTMRKTVDSGKTWNPVPNVTTNLNFNCMWAPSVYEVAGAKVIVVGADSGFFYSSRDRGNTFTKVSSGTKKSIRGVTPAQLAGNITVLDIWACGDSGMVVRSTSAGASWVAVSSNWNEVRMNGIGVMKGTNPASDTAFTVGSDGHIFRIYGSAGAVVIDTSFNGTGAPLNGITVFNGRAWVVGDSGYIYYKAAVNQPWRQLGNGVTTANLKYVYFADTARGFVFGDHGTLLQTTDGGSFWTVISSGTNQNLRGGNILPLNKRIDNFYSLSILAKRKQFYQDQVTGRVNYDFFTKIDTGYIIIDPNLPNFFNTNPKVSVGGYAIIINDSAKFGDHTKLGPGRNTTMNTSIAYYNAGAILGARAVKWDLLNSGEIKLFRYHSEYRESTFTLTFGNNTISQIIRFLVSSDSTVLDVVRYGNFLPTGTDPYPNNRPMGFIPEWSSIARYQDDPGYTDPQQMNTSYSFYITPDAIPGWGSQLKRKK